METSVMAWLFYCAVVLVLFVLSMIRGFHELDQLTDTRTDLSARVKGKPRIGGHASIKAEQKLIKRRVRRSLTPFILAAFTWTLCLLLYVGRFSSTFTLSALFVASALLILCVVLFIRSAIAKRRLKRSHIGVMRR